MKNLMIPTVASAPSQRQVLELFLTFGFGAALKQDVNCT